MKGKYLRRWAAVEADASPFYGMGNLGAKDWRLRVGLATCFCVEPRKRAKEHHNRETVEQWNLSFRDHPELCT